MGRNNWAGFVNLGGSATGTGSIPPRSVDLLKKWPQMIRVSFELLSLIYPKLKRRMPEIEAKGQGAFRDTCKDLTK